MAGKLTIVLPGLGVILSQEIITGRLPTSLKQILKHGKKTPQPGSLDRCLFELYSQTPLSGTDLPDMALAGEDASIGVSPCYLRADRDQLRLFGPDSLGINTREAQALIALIQPLFDGDLTLESADKWRLSYTEPPQATFTALADVVGKNVQPYLPAGEQASSWIRLWNEIQMVLHECEINEQRALAGKPPINSVWFWGLGEFEADRRRWQHVMGDYPLLTELSNRVGLSCQPSPIEMGALVRGNYLRLMPEFSLEQDIESQLAALEQTVFKPIMQQLKWRKCSQASFVFPELARYEVSTLSAWKQW